ncbi:MULTISPECIES: DUF2505 domain-containing protein [Gordonia]|uniref:DUF2505 domain-containing protein n=2 Tax=Gordonia TaxID=2053 RepID=L7LP99_9ACTN|nr:MULTISPECIES: DUF2505 domain-containing protein [Gordonia]AUH67980.1 DUF2505 domain-containing protein [Gordonia sp. YC-JH1]WFN92297.1 DUF2505 domain-containing protein [Gordonia sihwensis]GAC61942.1 hypothetical protein GSI01S_26_00090 [Gordonia sihwensis NBRC 108236]
MARRLSYSARYPHSAEKIYQALSQKKYWEDLMVEFRELTPISNVEEFETGDDGIRVVLQQTITRDMLPPIAQTVMLKDMMITRTENYGVFDPVNTDGSYSASIPAGPGSLTGRQELFPTDTGCTIRKTTEVKVYIPFVNAKLEQLMLVNLVDLFRGEAEFTSTWVEDNLA